MEREREREREKEREKDGERERKMEREREGIKWAHQCFCLTWTNLCGLLTIERSKK